MDYNLPGSVHGIFQARLVEWVAISFSRGSSWPRNWTCISNIPATRCLANTLPQSQRQVQGFHKVNTSPCHSALTAVFRSLSLDVRRPGTASNKHNLRAKEHFIVGQVSHARTNHGLFLGLQASLPAYAQPRPRPSPITPWTLFQH